MITPSAGKSDDRSSLALVGSSDAGGKDLERQREGQPAGKVSPAATCPSSRRLEKRLEDEQVAAAEVSLSVAGLSPFTGDPR
jgi:hypothetical protein